MIIHQNIFTYFFLRTQSYLFCDIHSLLLLFIRAYTWLLKFFMLFQVQLLVFGLWIYLGIWILLKTIILISCCSDFHFLKTKHALNTIFNLSPITILLRPAFLHNRYFVILLIVRQLNAVSLHDALHFFHLCINVALHCLLSIQCYFWI